MVGVDVGGTKIAAGVVDADGQIYSRIQLPTDTSSTEATLQSIADSITEAVHAAGINPAQIGGIGLGIPGWIDAKNGIGLYSVNLGWRNVHVKQWLEERLDRPCFIENDVSAASAGESIYGAGKGMKNLVYLSLGTGIAAGIIIGGRVYRGAHSLAGEIGHTAFVADGPRCLCGGRGCLEALAAGPALARKAQAAIEAGRRSSLQQVLLRKATITAEEIFVAATQGDNLALEVLAEAGAQIASAIYLLAMAFDPHVVILGGGLALEDGPFITAIRSELQSRSEASPVFREIITSAAVRLTSLKRDAGILGAAALVVAGKDEEGLKDEDRCHSEREGSDSPRSS